MHGICVAHQQYDGIQAAGKAMSVEAESILNKRIHMDEAGWISELHPRAEMHSLRFSGAKREMQMQLRELLLSIRYLTYSPLLKNLYVLSLIIANIMATPSKRERRGGEKKKKRINQANKGHLMLTWFELTDAIVPKKLSGSGTSRPLWLHTLFIHLPHWFNGNTKGQID